MRLLLTFCLLSVVVAYVSAAQCSSNDECTRCPTGYHELCENNHCQCHNHHCTVKSDCPHGQGTGCADHCAHHCVDSKCTCTCN